MKKDNKGHTPFSSPVHYSPCSGDCIPFYENGSYHLMILKDGGWQHLKSKDLINWTELPPVLKRGEADETDGEWCFTGHIMEHEGTFHIFYPGVNRKHPKGNMCMMHATSKDMINFTKHHDETWWPDGIHYRTKAQSDHVGAVEHPTMKDQCVIWNQKEKKWWMFFSGEAIGVVGEYCALAVSDDLVNWKQVPPIKGLATGDCTDIFKFGDWWYRTSNVNYWRARELAGPWSGPVRYDTDYLVVPKGLWDGKRRVMIGGLRNLYASLDFSDSKNVHVTSIPREIYADKDGDLCTRPVKEAIAQFPNVVLDLKSKPKPLQKPLTRCWEPKGKGQMPWKYEGGALVNFNAHQFETSHCSFDVPRDYMVEATVDLEHVAEMAVGFHEEKGMPNTGYRLIVNRRTGEGDIRGPSAAFPRKIKIDPNKPIKIQAFVVESIMECWINDAYAFCFRDRTYEGGQLSFMVNNGRARILDLKVSTAE